MSAMRGMRNLQMHALEEVSPMNRPLQPQVRPATSTCGRIVPGLCAVVSLAILAFLTFCGANGLLEHWWRMRWATKAYVMGDGIPVILGNNGMDEEANFLIWFDAKYYKDAGPNVSCSTLPGRPKLVPTSHGMPTCMITTTGRKIQRFLNRRNIHLNNKKGVIYIEADSNLPAFTPIKSEGPAHFQNQWWLDRLDTHPRVFDHTFRAPEPMGEGVHVYVLDSGIRTTHQEFEGRAIPTLEIDQYGLAHECQPWDRDCAMDYNGHGTHVAGLVGGRLSGAAKRATIHAVKCTRPDGSLRLSWAVAAMQWVMENGQRPAIISMSLGNSDSPDSWSLDNALQASLRHGVPVIVAAGNSPNGGMPGTDACRNSPGREPAAITVGFTDSDDRVGLESNQGRCVDILAPGKSLVSAKHTGDADYQPMTGTSMATPLVSGVAAIGLSRGVTPRTIKSWLLQISTKGAVANAWEDTHNRLLYIG